MRRALAIAFGAGVALGHLACGATSGSGAPADRAHGASGGDAARAKAVADGKCNEALGRGARLLKEGRFGWAFICEGASETPGVGVLAVFRDGEAEFMSTSVPTTRVIEDLEAGYRPHHPGVTPPPR